MEDLWEPFTHHASVTQRLRTLSAAGVPGLQGCPPTSSLSDLRQVIEPLPASVPLPLKLGIITIPSHRPVVRIRLVITHEALRIVSSTEQVLNICSLLLLWLSLKSFELLQI